MVETVGERLLEEAREIAFPRAAGSEGDPRARRIVMRRFRDAGLEVTEQPFSYDIRIAFRAIRAMLIASGLLIGAAGFLAPRSAPLALGLLALGLVANGALLVWAPGVEKLYAREGPTRTANVEARRRASKRRLTLVCLAHYDSKSQNLTLPWRNALTILAILGGLGLAGVLLSGVLRGTLPGPAWLPALLGGVSALSLFALSTLTSGNESPGGTDNAGSVAIVCELARRLPTEIDPDVELIFLSPSAEEDHMVGAMRWLDAHREELASGPAYAINLDGAGSPGKAVLLEWYGAGSPFGPTVSKAARAAASEAGIPVRRVWLPPAMGVDAIPFRHRGIECVTLASGELGRATMAVHSAGDVADNLDVESLERLFLLALGTARALAEIERVPA
jgi:hypothetical protein